MLCVPAPESPSTPNDGDNHPPNRDIEHGQQEDEVEKHEENDKEDEPLLRYHARYLLAIGSRRSRPNAFGVIFTPGGACLRLYSLRSTICATRATVA